jgi:hypothetical protein
VRVTDCPASRLRVRWVVARVACYLLFLLRYGLSFFVLDCCHFVSSLCDYNLLGVATLSAYNTAGGVDAGVVTAYFLILALSALLLSESTMEV